MRSRTCATSEACSSEVIRRLLSRNKLSPRRRVICAGQVGPVDDGPGGKDSRAAIDVSLLFFPDTFPPRSSMGSRPRPARRARISPREDVDKGTDSTPRRARRVRAPSGQTSAPFVLRATGRSRNRPNAATRGSSKHVRWCHFSSVEPFGRILDPQTTRAVRYATATEPRRRPKNHSSLREPIPREPSANPHPAH